MAYIAEKRGSGGSYQKWDLDKYTDYRRVINREQKRSEACDHPLLGAKFQYGGGIAVITRVDIHWWAGYHYHAVYEINNSGSHGTTIIENINSIDPHILDELERFKREFTKIN